MPAANDLSDAEPYGTIGAYYDLEHDPFDDDVQMILDFALSVGDPILEIGCGSGRLLAPLAAAGHRVTGLDRSPAMLDRARERLVRDGLSARVRLVAGDAAEAATVGSGTFGLVVIGLNGLMHLDTPDSQRRALAAARMALDPRGLLLIDVVNPTPETLRGFEVGLVHEGSWSLPGGDAVDKFASRTLHHDAQQIETHLWYDRTGPDGAMRRLKTDFTLRWVTRAELELMLELTGFADWQVYGGYELDPFDGHSERLIVAAEASPSPVRPGGPID